MGRSATSHYVNRFGVPLKITTDRESQFTSKVFAELANFLGSHTIVTTAYHPQGNGMVERFHRQLKAAIMASGKSQRWSELLPIALFGLRSVFKEGLQSTAAEMVHGQSLRLPGEIVTTNASSTQFDYITTLREHFKNVDSELSHHRKLENGVYIPKDLSSCKYAFIRRREKRPLQQPYKGPYRVIEKNDIYFKLLINENVKTVSIDRIKPAYVEGSELDKDIKIQRNTKRVTFNLLDINFSKVGVL